MIIQMFLKVLKSLGIIMVLDDLLALKTFFFFFKVTVSFHLKWGLGSCFYVTMATLTCPAATAMSI